MMSSRSIRGYVEDSLSIVRVKTAPTLDFVVIKRHGIFVVSHLDFKDEELVFPKVVVIYLIIAAGFKSSVVIAPAVGDIVADLVTQGKTFCNLSEFTDQAKMEDGDGRKENGRL